MHSTPLFPRPVSSLVALLVAVLAAGCGVGLPVRTSLAVVERDFPTRIAPGVDVVDDGEHVRAGALTITRHVGRDGAGPVRIDVGGRALFVREDRAFDDVDVGAGVVTLADDDGAGAVWLGNSDGAEEWLHLPGAAGGAIAGTWSVEGAASLVEDADRVRLLDDDGVAFAQVRAPAAFSHGVDGEHDVGVHLAVDGDTILAVLDDRGLAARARGDALLIDPFFEATGSLARDRTRASSALLTDASVLITTGRTTYNGTSISPPWEAWLPQFAVWQTKVTCPDDNTVGGGGTAAAALLDGRVLTYGLNCPYEATLYNPSTGATTDLGITVYDAGYPATLTRLPSGRVLIMGAGWGSADGKHPLLFDPSTNGFVHPGSPANVHAFATATLLADGRVLVAGAYNTLTAEIFDEGKNAFMPAGAMARYRAFATATRLDSGRVLVAGGNGDRTTEIYDPATNGWSMGPLMDVARSHACAVRLPNGNVLVAGGVDGTLDYDPSGTSLASTSIYSQSGNAWSPGPTMLAARAEPTCQLMPDGRVLVAGGEGVTSSEILDPSVMSATTPSITPRRFNSLTPLKDGDVLVAGGEDSGGVLSAAMVWHAATSSFTSTGSLAQKRRDHTATLLPDGRVLVAGGHSGSSGLASCELYDPATGQWGPAAAMPDARFFHTATLLDDGRVMVAGGRNAAGIDQSTVFFYTPSTDSWQTSSRPLSAARSQHKAVLMPSKKVLIVGNGTNTTTSELYDPVALTTSWMGTLPHPHGAGFTLNLLPTGDVIAVGGLVNNTGVNSVDLFSGVFLDWVGGTALPEATGRAFHTATLLPNNRLFVVGGQTAVTRQGTTTTWEYDAGAQRWKSQVLEVVVRDQAAAPLADGRVLVVGGTVDFDGSTPGFFGARVYDEGRGMSPAARPAVTSASVSLTPPLLVPHLNLFGARLIGPEASSGSPWQSTADIPLVRLVRVDSGQTLWLKRDTTTTSTAAHFTIPLNLVHGVWSATLYTAGMPSNAVLFTR